MKSPDLAHVLVADDNRLDRRLLARAVESLGHAVTTASGGRDCLQTLRDPASMTDVVLLDLVMPDVDGFAVLAELRADEAVDHVPVIVVSAADDLDSVVRSIELGATDHLAKPVRRRLLEARLTASLADKRVRDLERDHREQVQRVVSAAVAVEHGSWDGHGLEEVAARDDALGTLARVFGEMARQVAARERALRDELGRLRIEIDRERLADRVAAVTDTDYYQGLRSGAAQLRRVLLDDDPHATGDDSQPDDEAERTDDDSARPPGATNDGTPGQPGPPGSRDPSSGPGGPTDSRRREGDDG